MCADKVIKVDVNGITQMKDYKRTPENTHSSGMMMEEALNKQTNKQTKRLRCLELNFPKYVS